MMAVDGNAQRRQPEALYATEKIGMPKDVVDALELVLMSVRERKRTPVSRGQRLRAAATSATDLWWFAGREANRLEREGEEKGAAVVRQAEGALGRLERRLRSSGYIEDGLDGLHRRKPCLRPTVAVTLGVNVRTFVNRFALYIKEIHATEPGGSPELTLARIAALRDDMSVLDAFVAESQGSEGADELIAESLTQLAEVAERMREEGMPGEAAAKAVEERGEESEA